MDNDHKPSDSECYTPLLEPIRFLLLICSAVLWIIKMYSLHVTYIYWANKKIGKPKFFVRWECITFICIYHIISLNYCYIILSETVYKLYKHLKLCLTKHQPIFSPSTFVPVGPVTVRENKLLKRLASYPSIHYIYIEKNW
jgi:hypothetical protein